MPFQSDMQFVQNAGIPVYGVLENLFGLQLTGVGTNSRFPDMSEMDLKKGTDEQQETFSCIFLNFASKHQADSRILVNLYSYNAQDKKTYRSVMRSISQPAPHFSADPDYRTLRQFRFGEEQRRELGKPDVIHRQVMISEQQFTGEIHHWPRPPYPSWFLLMKDDELLRGEVLGLTQDELPLLFQKCAVVNHRSDIMQQYQEELENAWPDWLKIGSEGREPAWDQLIKDQMWKRKGSFWLFWHEIVQLIKGRKRRPKGGTKTFILKVRS